jgi:orotate phosphoribosyltransferase
MSETTAIAIAKGLLAAGAVKVQPDNPFTWASGWKSPIYCDNRLTLSYPKLRTEITEALVAAAKAQFSQATAVAGVATAGIPQGALLADRLQLPFLYVRSSAKAHGMGNKIEGKAEAGAKVIVVEDLISTGGSSLKAVEALREAGCEVLGLLAIFTYGFPQAKQAFAEANVPFATLSNYSTLLEVAQQQGLVQQEQLASLEQWRQEPEVWGK